MPSLAEAIGWKSVCALLESLERTREKKLRAAKLQKFWAWAERTVGRPFADGETAVLLRLLHPLADSRRYYLKERSLSEACIQALGLSSRGAGAALRDWQEGGVAAAASDDGGDGDDEMWGPRVGFTSTVKGQGDLSAVIQSTIDERVGSLSGPILHVPIRWNVVVAFSR